MRACIVPAMALLSLFISNATGASAQAADTGHQTWPEKKCGFYRKAWHELLDLSGRKGITTAFVEGNEAFIAAGCSNGADVCPSSAQDIDLANKLAVAAMNFGTASSFLPFICRVKPTP